MTVSGQANIFGSGYGDAPAAGGGGGVVPVEIGIASGTTHFTFFATGAVSPIGSTTNGPDGGNLASGTTDLNSLRSISGIVNSDATMFLVGVFLSDSVPGSAPSRLDFTGNSSFATLSPELGQTFFIGDGLTGTGTGDSQEFYVPTGATRLFLGFADGFSFNGNPGWYGDNTGSLEVEVNPVPEPATMALLGFGALAALKRRKKA